jgi:uncharacterized phiE125 gp8 family phage protein
VVTPVALELITAPTTYPITLAEAKLHLHVDHSDEDSLINLLIDSATAHVDGPGGFLGRALINQTWELVLDAFPDDEITVPLPPLIEVISVKYDNTAGNEQVLAAGGYKVDMASEPGRIVSTGTWPTTIDRINAVRVRFRAGYVDTGVSPAQGKVPGDIKAGILLYLGSLYANREQVVVGTSAVPLPWGAEELLLRKRIELSMA